ncbi:hypothetical protein [Geminocystis sp. NIES-3709]|uniref:hypothetical protein n=1 Tax=Geminocystis sp. NIES-3709 TaxID=1617448 RepID=UPI0005FCC226|nr:hypothetical protein [Geminocystis sp. NIES-3709]BAQ65578.1 hypothetical protein GM3709_2343 [Geminocystis sp. NIES-3709]
MRKTIVTKKGNVAEGNFNLNTPEAKEAIESVIDAGTEYLRNKLNHQKEKN